MPKVQNKERPSYYLGGKDRRIMVQGQLSKLIRLCGKNELSLMIHNCNPSYLEDKGRRITV
jgi:hypothetical protein